ncbi:MAG: hypothetical protein QM817_13500 [Archangium sp.]
MHALALVVTLMSGQLLSDRVAHPEVHLIDASTVEFFGGGVLGATKSNTDIASMSVRELKLERADLLESQRSVVAPVIMLVTAVIAYAVGGLFLAWGGGGAGFIIALGIGLLVAATALAIPAIILLATSASFNAKTMRRVHRINEQLDEMRNSPKTDSEDAPPPPPTRPPSSGFLQVVEPRLVIASF